MPRGRPKKQTSPVTPASQDAGVEILASASVAADTEEKTKPAPADQGGSSTGNNGSKPKAEEQETPEGLLAKLKEIDAAKFGTLKIRTVSPEHGALLLGFDHFFKPEYLALARDFLMGDPSIRDEVQPKDRFGRLLDKQTGKPIPKITREYSPQVLPNNPARTGASIAEAQANGWRFCNRNDNPEFIDEAFGDDGRIILAFGEYVLMWRSIEHGKKVYEADHAQSRAIRDNIFGSDKDQEGHSEFGKRALERGEEDQIGGAMKIQEDRIAASRMSAV